MKKTILLFSLFIAFGCTDLEPEVLYEAFNSHLPDGPGAAEGILAPVYGRMNQLYNSHENWFLLLARNQHFSLTNLVSTGTDGGSITR